MTSFSEVQVDQCYVCEARHVVGQCDVLPDSSILIIGVVSVSGLVGLLVSLVAEREGNEDFDHCR